jgi:hypothetical protein
LWTNQHLKRLPRLFRLQDAEKMSLNTAVFLLRAVINI